MCIFLMLPVLQFDQFAKKCKFKGIEIVERNKSLMFYFPNDEIITLYKSTETDFWTKSKCGESTDVYCCIGKNTSIFSIKKLLTISEEYSSNLPFVEKYSCELLDEYYGADALLKICDKIQDGVWVNVFTLQRLLKKMIARKRWKLILCFGRIRKIYRDFMEEYYAPPDRGISGGMGYASAMDHFKCKVDIVEFSKRENIEKEHEAGYILAMEEWKSAIITDENQGIKPGQIDLNNVLEAGEAYNMQKMFELDGKCFLSLSRNG